MAIHQLHHVSRTQLKAAGILHAAGDRRAVRRTSTAMKVSRPLLHYLLARLIAHFLLLPLTPRALSLWVPL